MTATTHAQRLGLATMLACSLSLAACSSDSKPANPPATSTAAAISVSKEVLLVSAVQNLDGLEPDARMLLVSELLDGGASPDAENELGEPVLADAIHFGDGKSYDLRVVQLLLEKGADVSKVGATGRSPLTKAAENGKADVIELLLARGLDLNTENGGRALVKAAFNGHKHVVSLFVARGFKPSGRYESALLSLSSEESEATAKVFGAYVDIASEELNALLGVNTRAPADRTLEAQLGRIDATCKVINQGTAVRDNMSDYFNRTEECTSMGRLGSLAYMHCYGMLRSNSASLQLLQGNINRAALSARAVMEWRDVKFEQISSHSELAAYDKAIRRSLALYQDVVLPWARATGGKMGHHKGRNRQLREQAEKCGNKVILKGAHEISSAVTVIDKDQLRQQDGFRQEIAAMEKMRASIVFQLPALGSAEELKRREEQKKKQDKETQKEEGEGEQPLA